MWLKSIFSALALGIAGAGSAVAEPLTVLSYNVCWQCMSPGRYGLGGQCRDTTVMDGGVTRAVTTCSEAMGKAIDGYAQRYDFVGLQEASNWRDFRFLAPNTLGKMQAITRPRSGSEEMVIFYDPNRFTHRFTSMNGDMGRGRPIMVNLFTDDQGARYAYVNLHNCHAGCSFQKLTHAIDDALRHTGEHDNDSNPIKRSAADYAVVAQFLSEARIIVTGDFNEVAYQQTGDNEVSWPPFFDAGIDTRTKVEDAPTTCCSTRIPWRCSGLEPWCRPGDYVFDSASAARPFVPAGYDDTVPQSDHKPVLAILP